MKKSALRLVIEGKLLTTKASHFLACPEESGQAIILATEDDVKDLVAALHFFYADIESHSPVTSKPYIDRLKQFTEALEWLQREAFPDNKAE